MPLNIGNYDNIVMMTFHPFTPDTLIDTAIYARFLYKVDVVSSVVEEKFTQLCAE